MTCILIHDGETIPTTDPAHPDSAPMIGFVWDDRLPPGESVGTVEWTIDGVANAEAQAPAPRTLEQYGQEWTQGTVCKVTGMVDGETYRLACKVTTTPAAFIDVLSCYVPCVELI